MNDFDLNDLNTPRVDFIILADRAEVLNGKLYMMGGGWDRITVVDFAQPTNLGLAVAVNIPWNATNQQHNLAVRVETLDTTELNTVQVGFTPGRPPVLRTAEAQRVIFALGQAITLPGPGTYTIKALLNDDVANQRTTYFHAVMAPSRPQVSSR